MTYSHPTPVPCQWFPRLVSILDRRSAPRLALLFLGAVLARGRRTVTAWIRAAKLSDYFRPCYAAVAAAGKKADSIAARLVIEAVKPLTTGARRLTLALDDTPTKRYGPHAQGAGIHHNPAPGPAGSPHVYGHVFVVPGLLAVHPSWGTVALPLLPRLYVRRKDLPAIDPKHRPEFRTRLGLGLRLGLTRMRAPPSGGVRAALLASRSPLGGAMLHRGRALRPSSEPVHTDSRGSQRAYVSVGDRPTLFRSREEPRTAPARTSHPGRYKFDSRNRGLDCALRSAIAEAC